MHSIMDSTSKQNIPKHRPRAFALYLAAELWSYRAWSTSSAVPAPSWVGAPKLILTTRCRTGDHGNPHGNHNNGPELKSSNPGYSHSLKVLANYQVKCLSELKTEWLRKIMLAWYWAPGPKGLSITSMKLMTKGEWQSFGMFNGEKREKLQIYFKILNKVEQVFLDENNQTYSHFL